MGARTVFLRSPVGNRTRSPLGAFKCRATRFLEIFTVPVILFEGETHLITGELFGAVQGSGYVVVSNTPVPDSSAILQTIVSWDDDEIVFTFVSDPSLGTDALVWITVYNNEGQSDTAASYLSAINDEEGITNFVVSPGSGVDLCGIGAGGRYCTLILNLDTQLTDAGYGLFSSDFFSNTPGFYLVGQDSGNTVEFGPWQHSYTSVSIGTSNPNLVWCGTVGSFAYNGNSNIGSGAGRFLVIGYDRIEPQSDASYTCIDLHGWSAGEDIFLVPKYPVTIGITAPVDGFAGQNNSITFEAYAFGASGEISANIQWYTAESFDGSDRIFVGSGAQIVETIPTPGRYVLAQITRNGQSRWARKQINVAALQIDAVDPSTNSAGSPVTIEGTGFTATTSVEFGGVVADNIVFVDIDHLTCDVPAGSGTVDVEVIDGPFSDTLVAGFTYGSGPPNPTLVTPNSGTVAGGTSVTITGTNFTSDCQVAFGTFPGSLSPATSVTFVNSTTITCDTPASPVGTGLVDVVVVDIVAMQFGVLTNGYTYT